jgi:hypothetical protein
MLVPAATLIIRSGALPQYKSLSAKPRISATCAGARRLKGFKQLAVRQHPDGQTHHEPVSRELAEKSCLDSTQLHSLYQLAARCDDVYGADPHDIEWAFHAHTLHLLQRRPITTSLI